MTGSFRIEKINAHEKIRHIQMLVFDVDGVLTNGALCFGSDGSEYKCFSVKDGLGFTLARRAGLKTAIITARQSAIVERRAQELKIDAFYQGNDDKKPAFQHLLDQFQLSPKNLCYIGDDLFDIAILQQCGFSAAPVNAQPEVLALVDYVTSTAGGDGAARELIEMILKIQGKWEQVLDELDS